MKVEKDGIVKDVPEEIVSDYISAGWEKAKEKKEIIEKSSDNSNKNNEMKKHGKKL